MDKSESDMGMGIPDQKVMLKLENPYSTYLVQFPYSCIFTIPQDGNVTRVTIDSRSEVMRYGKNEHDIKLQMELDQAHGKATYATHILKWVGDRISTIDPREPTVTYGTSTTIELMSDQQIDNFREGCLKDE